MLGYSAPPWVVPSEDPTGVTVLIPALSSARSVSGVSRSAATKAIAYAGATVRPATAKVAASVLDVGRVVGVAEGARPS